MTRNTGSASRKEILAWAMYDVANSTYATIVATAVYNAYFIKVIVGQSISAAHAAHGTGTLMLTIVICIAALLVAITAPILGSLADATATKKKFLFLSTMCCALATGCLALVRPGDYIVAMLLLVMTNVAFGTGENFIASFLPELATKEDMGRISAFGWGAGYVGGLFSLGTCLAYVSWAQRLGQPATQYVPVIMVGCAVFFAVASLPTFLFLKERAVADPLAAGRNHIRVAYERLRTTFSRAQHYRDLFNLLITIFIYSCGTTTIVHLASVYAQEVLKFTAKDSLVLILVVDITAAIGAFIFGIVQDKIGSIRTLTITLAIWTVAVVLAYCSRTKLDLWIAGNIVGLAMGACGSAGRALVGQFSPQGKSGEFLGLWGVAVKLATAVGALSFGLIIYATHNNYRIGMISTGLYFVAGLIMLRTVNEERGFKAAHEGKADPQ